MAITGSPDLGNHTLVTNATRASVNRAFDGLVSLIRNDKVWPLIPKDIKHISVNVFPMFSAILDLVHTPNVSIEIWKESSGNLADTSGTMIFPTFEYYNFTDSSNSTVKSHELINPGGSRFQYIGNNKILYFYDHEERIMDIGSIPVGTVIIYKQDAVANSCADSIIGEVKKTLFATGEITKIRRALALRILTEELTLVAGKVANIMGSTRGVITELGNYLDKEGKQGIDPEMLIKSKILRMLGRPRQITVERAVRKDVILINGESITAGTLKKFTFTRPGNNFEQDLYAIGDTLVPLGSEIYHIPSGFTVKMVNDLISSLKNEGPESLRLDVMELLLVKMAKWSERRNKIKEKLLKKLP